MNLSKPKNWIQGAINPANKGALHRELNIPEGQTIPAMKLNKAAQAGGVEGKRAQLAKTLKGLNK